MRTISYILVLATIFIWGVMESESFYVFRRALQLSKRPWEGDEEVEDCPVYQNEALHAVMDRVCDMCHQMFGHEDPNMRTNCRTNCFKNQQFSTCLSLFSPAGDLPIPPMRRRLRIRSSWY